MAIQRFEGLMGFGAVGFVVYGLGFRVQGMGFRVFIGFMGFTWFSGADGEFIGFRPDVRMAEAVSSPPVPVAPVLHPWLEVCPHVPSVPTVSRFRV